MPRRKSDRSLPKLKTLDAYLSKPDSTGALTLPLETIRFPSHQPRRYFDPDKMQHLMNSIQEHGILEPILVRSLYDGEYEIVAGERRFRAAQELGLSEIPAVVRDLDDQQALQVALVENLQREDLNPLEETEAVLELLSLSLEIDQKKVISLLNQSHNARKRNQELTQNVLSQLEKIDEVLSMVGRFSADSFRASRLPLLSLPEDILSVLRKGELEYTKAQAIARIKEKRQRTKVVKEAISKQLSLSDIKARVQSLMPEPEQTPIRVLTSRLNTIGKRLKKTEVWRDSSTQQRITELLDELDQLTTQQG
jgi:ParB family chromosome partitioning protein